MIITIAGDLGSGKSTVAKLLAKELNYKHYSSGDLMRNIAKEKGIPLNEFSKKAQTDDKIDRAIDAKAEELGKTENNFVMDGHIAFNFIPKSIKIFIKVDEKVAAQRIHEADRQEEQYESIEKTLTGIQKRKVSELKRFKDYYNIDYRDMNLFDFVIDSTNISAEEVVRLIKEFLSN